MNHITFNRDFKRADLFSVYQLENSEYIKQAKQTLPNSVLSSPIFIYQDPEDDILLSIATSGDIITSIQNDPDYLPFKEMRLFVIANNTDSQYGNQGFKAWLKHDNGILQIRAHIAHRKIPSKMMFEIFSFNALSQDPRGIAISVRIGGELLPKNHFSYQKCNEIGQAVFTSITWFLREYHSPANFSAKVVPKGCRHRSVEWLKARTHYVLVHKTHPANKKGASGKFEPDGEYVKRQAHTRRAHDRILRHPRYKANIGKVIRIKACWCGPAEWQQARSIYKIIK